jgi:hypothetical protein
MEELKRSAIKRSPVLFCLAVTMPILVMALGMAVSSRYIWPHPGGYTPVNVILAFMLAEIVLTWGLVVWGWIRGDRPRWLALFGPVLSIWWVWHIFFA